MAPRAPSAYFIFAGEVRPSIQQEVAAQNDGKASVALVGKEIGRRWNELTDEQKQKYKDIAAQKALELKEQLEKERQEAAEAGEGDEQGDGDGGDAEDHPTSSKSAPPLPPFGLPTSLVKKIACMDPEVSRLTADGVRALSKAATLFIGLLAEQAYTNARQLKRKNFKFSDIEEVARSDRRMVDMGLSDMLTNDKVFIEVHEKVEEENKNRKANKEKAAAEAKDKEGAGKVAMKPMTDFFTKAPAETAAEATA